jgi:hypothetical protein
MISVQLCCTRLVVCPVKRCTPFRLIETRSNGATEGNLKSKKEENQKQGVFIGVVSTRSF